MSLELYEWILSLFLLRLLLLLLLIEFVLLSLDLPVFHRFLELSEIAKSFLSELGLNWSKELLLSENLGDFARGGVVPDRVLLEELLASLCLPIVWTESCVKGDDVLLRLDVVYFNLPDVLEEFG